LSDFLSSLKFSKSLGTVYYNFIFTGNIQKVVFLPFIFAISQLIYAGFIFIIKK